VSKHVVEHKLINYSCVYAGICIISSICVISLFFTIAVFWDVIPCSLVDRYHSFEGTCYDEDGGTSYI
jgi:hypothetical protein